MPPPQLSTSKKPMIDCPKRIRVFYCRFIIDTKEAKLVWEVPYYPTYFFPQDALDDKYLHESATASGSKSKKVYDLVVGDCRAEGAVTKYFGGEEDPELEGMLKITFSAMHAWFEEEEEIFVHPKDPFKRVEALQSSRHVRVEINGVEVANTHDPMLLFETGLPIRTYIKKTDCRLDLFRPSDTTSQCPYKGIANYYHIKLDDKTVVKDILWWYRSPLLEVAGMRGRVAFFDEKVDVWVDGVKQKRPVSPWS